MAGASECNSFEHLGTRLNFKGHNALKIPHNLLFNFISFHHIKRDYLSFNMLGFYFSLFISYIILGESRYGVCLCNRSRRFSLWVNSPPPMLMRHSADLNSECRVWLVANPTSTTTTSSPSLYPTTSSSSSRSSLSCLMVFSSFKLQVGSLGTSLCVS